MNLEQREQAERAKASRTLPPCPTRSRHPIAWQHAVHTS